MFYRYFSILLATGLVIAGLQVPSFINQYQQRLSAHLIEVTANLEGFQRIADEYHGGSLAALIAKHRISTDTTFSAEAAVISSMYEHMLTYEAALNALDTTVMRQLIYLITAADTAMLTETVDHYAYTITLDTTSLWCGLVFLIIGIVVLDLLRALILRAFRPRKPAITP